MKKIFSVVLAFSMAITVFNSVAASTTAETVSVEPTFTVAEVSAVTGDTDVNVEVAATNNPGVAGMTLSVEYDDTVLTLKKVTNGEVLSGLTFQKPKTYKNGCNLVWYGSEPEEIIDGKAFTMIFDVSENATPGSYPVKLTYSSGTDVDLNPVVFAVVNGNITVSSNNTVEPEEPSEEPSEEPVEGPFFTVSKISAVTGDTDVNVEVAATNNPGVAGMTLSVEYDDTVLTLKKVTNGEVLSGLTFQKPKTYKNGCNLVWYGSEPEEIIDGKAFTMIFDVSENATPGSYPVKLTYSSGTDVDLNPVVFSVVAGSITISSAEHNATVSGNIKAFGDATKDVVVELLSGSTVVGTRNIAGNSGLYSFEGIASGTYKIRVSKSKHAPREYEITVGETDVTQDVEIWLYGDVTKDGIVNNSDVMQINRRNANLSSVFLQTADSDYRLKVANVTAPINADTIVNNTDIIHINRKNANLSSVFDRIA